MQRSARAAVFRPMPISAPTLWWATNASWARAPSSISASPWQPLQDPGSRPDLSRIGAGGRGLRRTRRLPHQRPVPRAATPEGAARGDADWKLDGVTVERGASLGAHSVVVAGCRVGAWAMIGSGAVVTDDVPPHALVVGNPGRQIGWVCACGRRLETGDSGGSCGSCGRRYVHRSPGLEQVST